ncbi:thioesterase family protein [Dactylosporangium sp. NPDC006015]|uniref:thioesterase family protein n=1 Tax=Dactylosporangium sp. NPDC006015 TaxID=3154576 RepID=UPI0033AE7971
MAFYLPLGSGRFASTAHTRGPWDAGSQHAGPPAALLGRAVEQVAPPGMRVARLTFEIAKPVPIAELSVDARIVRQGRSVALVEAAIEPYMRCTALLIRAGADVVPAAVPPPTVHLDGATVKPLYPTTHDVGYHTAMDFRFSEGSFLERGPATAWLRMNESLVDGEEPSPLTRVLVAADSGNGISNELELRSFLFVNADLTVHLLRHPIGEWVCLRSATSIDPAGIGLADTALHDQHGPIGRSVQSLFVAPRR